VGDGWDKEQWDTIWYLGGNRDGRGQRVQRLVLGRIHVEKMLGSEVISDVVVEEVRDSARQLKLYSASVLFKLT
jgi:hypothetical protein